MPIDTILQQPPLLAMTTFLIFVIVGYGIGQLNKRVLTAAGVPSAVEGTAFERTARGLGSSTVSVVSRLSSWFIYGVGALIALHVLGVLDPTLFWHELTRFLPQVFVAILVFIVGVVVGDKVELIITERLRGIKLPDVNVIGRLGKYSIIYIAALIALSQVGVATTALLILLAVYVFGVVFLAGIAFRDLLPSGAAGVYLLLNQPYGIGDEVRFGDNRGIVQEVDLFVTRIEVDDEEYIVPNRRVFERGIVKAR